MKNQGPSYGLRKESIIETVSHLYQESLKTSCETPSQALFQRQQQHHQTTWTRPDTETEQLPTFC
jgi:hypothetical protein